MGSFISGVNAKLRPKRRGLWTRPISALSYGEAGNASARRFRHQKSAREHMTLERGLQRLVNVGDSPPLAARIETTRYPVRRADNYIRDNRRLTPPHPRWTADKESGNEAKN